MLILLPAGGGLKCSVRMQVIDQPESFNLLNSLLFNIPSNAGYSSCSQVSTTVRLYQDHTIFVNKAENRSNIQLNQLVLHDPTCDRLQIPAVPGLMSGSSFMPGSGPAMGYTISGPMSPLIAAHNLAGSHQNNGVCNYVMLAKSF